MKDQLSISLSNLYAKLISWFDSIVLNLPNAVLAIFVFFISYYLSKRISRKIVALLKNRVKESSIRNLIGSFVSVAIVCFGIILVLGIFDLDKALNSLIAGAGVTGLAISLALQGTLANTFAGIALSIKDNINIGDYIESNGFSGTVEDISLRDTKIRTSDNNLVIIPNNTISSNPYKNFSLTKDLRLILESGVGYESDLRRVEQTTIDLVNEHFPYRKDETEFNYLSFGDSAINFQLRFWIKATDKVTLTRVRSDAIIIIKEHFEKEAINIPYPTTTIVSDLKIA